MKCKKCSCELPEVAKFCPGCGAPVNKPERTQKHKSRGNGTGCVYKRGKSWYAVISTGYYENGQCRRKSKGGFKTKKEANDYIEQMRFHPTHETKIRDLYDALEPHLEKLSATKRTHYKTAYNRLQLIQNVNIGDLSVVDLQTVVDENAATYYPAKDMRDLLSLIYQQAMMDDYVAVNKAKFIVLPDLDEKDTVPFTADEIKALWADYQAGNTLTGFFLLMIYTGMMPGEARKVTVDMIQIAEKRIVGAGLKTTKRKETPIVLPDIIVPVVEDLMDGKTGRLWATDENSFYEYWKNMKQRTGCRQIPELRPYSCRHTTATTLADRKVSAAIIQEVMRHAKITTTRRYVHLDQDAQANAMNAAFGDN